MKRITKLTDMLGETYLVRIKPALGGWRSFTAVCRYWSKDEIRMHKVFRRSGRIAKSVSDVITQAQLDAGLKELYEYEQEES
ncbi:MAG: hypothetical protein J5758_01420 [Abditibacteriota bacterium]|nr:hypothetical protein [Abditibacteriota bacterium]